MPAPIAENPFAVLTLIAAPAVSAKASSVLARGKANRLARLVDRALQTARRDYRSLGESSIKPAAETRISAGERFAIFLMERLAPLPQLAWCSPRPSWLGRSTGSLSKRSRASALSPAPSDLSGWWWLLFSGSGKPGWPCAPCPTKPHWRKDGRKISSS